MNPGIHIFLIQCFAFWMWVSGDNGGVEGGCIVLTGLALFYNIVLNGLVYFDNTTKLDTAIEIKRVENEHNERMREIELEAMSLGKFNDAIAKEKEKEDKEQEELDLVKLSEFIVDVVMKVRKREREEFDKDLGMTWGGVNLKSDSDEEEEEPPVEGEQPEFVPESKKIDLLDGNAIFA